MRKRILFCLTVCGFCIGISLFPTARPTAEEPVSFSKDIKPIFEKSCWGCHSGATQLSKLDLSTRDGALKGGEHGPAIVPGKADDSRLYRLVAGAEKPGMPLDGRTLSEEQIAIIKTWIDEGAHWDGASTDSAPSVATASAVSAENSPLPPGARDYWAFKLPVRPPVPRVAAPFTNPIDQFLEQTRQRQGLKAAPRADRLTLLRRAYLDLIGLPPTPTETAEFIADNAPGSWERLIDKLLASPHYGERWARHWLDVARYADSSGYEDDRDRPNVWRYRDYVVRSLNDDKPYDVFITEQLAGDEMDAKTADTYVATAFLRLGPRVELREADNPQYRFDYLDDMIATIGKGMLGLTLQCARCHNHKFDPILQRDYYALEASLFGYVETTYPLAAKDAVEAHDKKFAEVNSKITALRADIRTIETPYRERLKAEAIKREFPSNVQQAVAKPESERTEGERLLADQVLKSAVINVKVDEAMTADDLARKKTLEHQIEELNKEWPEALPAADIVTDGDYRFSSDRPTEGTVAAAQLAAFRKNTQGSYLHTGAGRYQPPPSYFLIRGDLNAKGARMNPGFVTVATNGNPPVEIPRPDGHTSGRRLALAHWLTSRDNPLPARVMMNRVWAHHFGRGIVGTLENFGKMGDRPTHPELLDWLAVEFMDRGWSLKPLHRLMMTSEAYQMASRYDDPSARAKDPGDDYLWRYRIRRLDAEVIRDSILAAAGTIDLTAGGPPFFPHIQDELLKAVSVSSLHGVYRNQPDGPEVWRRSIYAYTKRNLPFPMMQVFDLPDLNVSFGARNVSTVPTQALTLMNNDFIARQAGLLADRVRRAAGDEATKQIELAYRLTLTRPPTPKEMTVARELVEGRSLVDFTNVLLNLSEFLYTE